MSASERTRQETHRIVFEDAMHALKIGAPGLSNETKQAIAVNIAVRASHHLTEGAKEGS